MENILVAGVNTRAAACSLKRMGFTVYTADYFGVADLKPCVDSYSAFLSQTPGESCGRFEDTYNEYSILQLAKKYIPQVDRILCLAGVSPEKFPHSKVQGNLDVGDVDDKYLLYLKLKNKFNFPSTFKVSTIGEADEIAENYPDKSFILKPRIGAGGYGIRDYQTLHESRENLETYFDTKFDIKDYIIQEKLEGINLSASVLSTGRESKTILTSQQIVADESLHPAEPFGYCGNITPYTDEKVNQELIITSEEVIDKLGLIGSNGVDYILHDGELYLIEVNPRLQGTLECAELSLNMNMMEAHLEACQGNMIDVHLPQKFAVKKIVHAMERSQVGDLSFQGVYDLPAPEVIIEKGEPIATIINSGLIKEDILFQSKKMVGKIYGSIKRV